MFLFKNSSEHYMDVNLSVEVLHCEGEKAGKRAAPDDANATSNLVFTASAVCVLL